MWRPAGAILAAAAIMAAVVIAVTESGESRSPRASAGPFVRASTVVRPAGSPWRQRITIGHSVRGRRIEAVEIAAPGAATSVLVVGCIHGNEPAGIAITRRLLVSTPPSGVSLWVLPVLNPDGVAAHTRQNADLVDLNRNFPWHWQPLGVRGDLQYAGRRALSEPESRAARTLILRARPQITIWFHQPADLVDFSGGDPRIERRFARLVGLPVARLTRYPGSAVSWGNSVIPGSTAFVVELPPGPLSAASAARYVRAVLRIAARPV